MMKPAIVLTIICVVAAATLGFTYELTRLRIEEQRSRKKAASLETVLPGAVEFSLQTGSGMEYHSGLDAEGNLIGWVIEGERRGYSSLIRVMVGVDREGVISGINILEQGETPGLGDQAVKAPIYLSLWEFLRGCRAKKDAVRPPFQKQFAGKTLDALEVVIGPGRENIQTLTGATITSRAVTEAVRGALEGFLIEKGLR